MVPHRARLFALLLVSSPLYGCALSWGTSGADTPSLPSLAIPLTLPEAKPHAVEINDVSELKETRYHQKDPQPAAVSATTPPAAKPY